MLEEVDKILQEFLQEFKETHYKKMEDYDLKISQVRAFVFPLPIAHIAIYLCLEVLVWASL